MSASHLKADNLTAIVDYNKYQESGPISREMALEPFAGKWRAFGWHVAEVDGHDIGALIQTLRAAQNVRGQPSVVIAHTVKGKGVSFVEADYTFHGKALSPEQAQKAREELLWS
jgi:transketolase